jgi:hypothetical protein
MILAKLKSIVNQFKSEKSVSTLNPQHEVKLINYLRRTNYYS